MVFQRTDLYQTNDSVKLFGNKNIWGDTLQFPVPLSEMNLWWRDGRHGGMECWERGRTTWMSEAKLPQEAMLMYMT